MTLCVHSGFYTHPDSQFDTSWIPRAVKFLSAWCRTQNAEFLCEARSMTDWVKFAPFPHSWEFGSLVKFAVLRGFLQDVHRGDRFIWLDPDIYPTPAANDFDLWSVPRNAFWGERRHTDWCGFPAKPDATTWFGYRKRLWAGSTRDQEYFYLGSGMFSLSRQDAERFWAWVNADFDINTKLWWDWYRDKQMLCAARARSYGYENAQPWMFGTEEAFLEQWIEEDGCDLEQIPCNVHDVYYRDSNPLLVHYEGSGKKIYPTE
ncbi:hypothetical protein SH501x_000888 [Pirellulaceae bacterium SH501]